MVAAIYIDHVQSIVIALLVGMGLPAFAPRRLDASMGALLSYLLLQVAAYVVIVLIGFTLQQISALCAMAAAVLGKLKASGASAPKP